MRSLPWTRARPGQYEDGRDTARFAQVATKEGETTMKWSMVHLRYTYCIPIPQPRLFTTPLPDSFAAGVLLLFEAGYEYRSEVVELWVCSLTYRERRRRLSTRRLSFSSNRDGDWNRNRNWEETALRLYGVWFWFPAKRAKKVCSSDKQPHNECCL